MDSSRLPGSAGTAAPPRVYQRATPERTTLYEVVRENLQTLYAAVEDGFAGAALPPFVREEFEGYLGCGLLCRGFAHLKCEGCSEHRLVAVLCPTDGACASDPAGYGHLSLDDYKEAFRWSDIHTLAMYPVGPVGYSGTLCTDAAAGGLCVVSGDSEKCSGSPLVCPGIKLDLAAAFDKTQKTNPFVHRAVAVVPEGYLRFHGVEAPGEYVAGYAAQAPDAVVVKGEAAAGTSSILLGAHLPAAPHEIAHTYGLPDLDPSQPITQPQGYWVGCEGPLALAFPACETHSPDPGQLNLMEPAKPGIEPPGMWIESSGYQQLLAALKITPDPSVLIVHGAITRAGLAELDYVVDLGGGSVSDIQFPSEFSITLLDGSGAVLVAVPVSTKFESSIQDILSGRTRIIQHAESWIMQKVEYPPETATVQIRRGDHVLAALDPLSSSLRHKIEGIPDRGYERNAEERRKTLLNKVDAFEKMLAAKELQGALQKLESDLRDKIEKWIVVFDTGGDAKAVTRSEVLVLIDRIAARIRFRIDAAAPDEPEAPSPTPTP